jgi:chromosome segregation ATPase
MSNGTIDPDSLTGKLIEMQELMDNQCNELISSRARVHELTNRNKELEERACLLQRDLSHAHEQLTKYQRDLKESQAQKEDQEERISTLEKRYLYIQKETTHLTEFNSRLENELATKETQLMHVSMKYVPVHVNRIRSRWSMFYCSCLIAIDVIEQATLFSLLLLG